MKKVELEIISLSHSITQSHSYAVILGEVNGLRRLPIIIGVFEAQAIAVALEKMKPGRPLTHDLMKNFLTAFSIDLLEINICDLQEGVFYSKLVCAGENETVEIDSRTSDALALAVRFGCPIYTYENILKTASMSIEETQKPKGQKSTDEQEQFPEENDLKKLTIDQLKKLLDEVLEHEDYIKAISIRDELKSRGSN